MTPKKKTTKHAKSKSEKQPKHKPSRKTPISQLYSIIRTLINELRFAFHGGYNHDPGAKVYFFGLFNQDEMRFATKTIFFVVFIYIYIFIHHLLASAYVNMDIIW